MFPRCWFNEKTTEAGLDALGYYHARKDDERNVDLGPEHNWASHAADAFGLMAIEEQVVNADDEERHRPRRPSTGSDAWLGA